MSISNFIKGIYSTGAGVRGGVNKKTRILDSNNNYLRKLHYKVETTREFINNDVPLDYLYRDDIPPIEECLSYINSSNVNLDDYYEIIYRGVTYKVRDALIIDTNIVYPAPTMNTTFLKLSVSTIVADIISLLLDIDVCACEEQLFCKLDRGRCVIIPKSEYDLIRVSSAINIATLSTVDYSTWSKIRNLYISIAKDRSLFNALRKLRRLIVSDKLDFDYPILMDINMNNSYSLTELNISNYVPTSVILSKAMEISIELLKEKSVPIRVSLAKKLPDIEGGKSMQSLMNALSDLLNSSVIITKEGDVVKVSVNPEQGSCLISPAENIPNITQLTVIKNGTPVPVISLNDEDVTMLIKSVESDNSILNTLNNSVHEIHQQGESIIESIQQAIAQDASTVQPNTTAAPSEFVAGSRRTVNGVTEELVMISNVPVWRVVSDVHPDNNNVTTNDTNDDDPRPPLTREDIQEAMDLLREHAEQLVDEANITNPEAAMLGATDEVSITNLEDEDDDVDNDATDDDDWDDEDMDETGTEDDEPAEPAGTRISLGNITIIVDPNGNVREV